MFAFGNVLNKVDYSYKPNIINDEYSKKIHALPVLPQNLNLEDVSELIDKLESGCFDIKILDDIKGLE